MTHCYTMKEKIYRREKELRKQNVPGRIFRLFFVKLRPAATDPVLTGRDRLGLKLLHLYIQETRPPSPYKSISLLATTPSNPNPHPDPPPPPPPPPAHRSLPPFHSLPSHRFLLLIKPAPFENLCLQIVILRQFLDRQIDRMAAAAVDPMVLGLGTSGGASGSGVVGGGVGRAGGGGAVMEGAQPVDLARHPSGIVPVLQNIVSTVNLDCRLDLKQIALQARNAEYNPKRFAAVIMRIRDPKTTALIFASGKMVCTGAKSEEHSKLAARKYARIVQKLGFPATFKDFKIQNIVASCDVKFPIRLEGLAYSHGAFSSYEPELFPGLIYRMKQPKIVLLVFVSGKIVLTGAKVRDEIYAAFENIYPVLTEYRKSQQ
ncbi:hypothetical protein VPH35_007821 [Triticum aestivum]